jgi:DNA-directed RNA polymerase subunit RPC12/RpoP
MKISPFKKVVANAEKRMKDGWDIYQQFNCAKCGAKQTMPDVNKFYTQGRCEECGHVTDIEKDGCNFMAASSTLNRFQGVR